MIVLKDIHVPYAPPDTIKTSSSYLISESKFLDQCRIGPLKPDLNTHSGSRDSDVFWSFMPKEYDKMSCFFCINAFYIVKVS